MTRIDLPAVNLVMMVSSDFLSSSFSDRKIVQRIFKKQAAQYCGLKTSQFTVLGGPCRPSFSFEGKDLPMGAGPKCLRLGYNGFVVTERIGRYDIVKTLGKGAMGVVYLARDPLIDRLVALKTLRLDVDTEFEEQFRQRFLREARAAGRLNHRGIVTVYDVGEDPETGLVYIAMEYIEGQDLKARMQAEPPLRLDEIARIVAEIALALDYAHSMGVVHRDIKPENILIISRYAKGITPPPSPAEIARDVIEKMEIGRKNARFKPGRMPVLLSPTAMADILMAFTGAVSGDLVARRVSPLTDRLGEAVLDPRITIMDDPLHPDGIMSAPCDDEGTPGTRKAIIDEGILKTFITIV